MLGRVLGLVPLLYGGYMVIRNALRLQLQAKYTDAAEVAAATTVAAVQAVVW